MKEMLIAGAVAAGFVAVVLIIRDNMPKASFSFKK